MKNILSWIWVAGAIGLCGCRTAGRARSHPDASVQIRQVLDAQVAAWNRGDLEGFMIGYHRSPDLRFASNNSVFNGWQGAHDSYTKAFVDKAKMSALRFPELDVQMLSEDVAMVFGRFINGFRDGRPEKTGLFTLIMKRMAEGWRIIHDHSSDAADKKGE